MHGCLNAIGVFAGISLQSSDQHKSKKKGEGMFCFGSIGDGMERHA
jgi:hypothetical protein